MERTRASIAAGPAAEFKAFEAEGWSRRATTYARSSGRLTQPAVQVLLDAAAVDEDVHLLDLGCGPGHVSAAAAARDAVVTGADLSEGMLAEARRHHPGVSFVHADAESLPFPAGSFEAVVGNFVLNHLPRPAVAASEIARVLGRGGRVALTVWDLPERMRYLGVVGEAMEDAGCSGADAHPEGEDPMRFADPGEFESLLSEAGFEQVRVEPLEWTVTLESAEALWHAVHEGSVRAAAQLEALSDDLREAVRAALERRCERYRTPDGIELPAAALLGSGRLP